MKAHLRKWQVSHMKKTIKTGTILSLLEGRIEEFCDDYCRYPACYKDPDELFEGRCQECPFIREFKLMEIEE